MRELDLLRGLLVGLDLANNQEVRAGNWLDKIERALDGIKPAPLTEDDIAWATAEATTIEGPTAETLQEANHLSDCAVHNAPAMEAGPCDCGGDDVFEQTDLPTADDVKGVLAPVTIGSYSDVSDDDVRAAGGEPVSPLAAAIAEHDAELAAIGQSNYDRIVSGDPFTSVKA